MSACILVAHPNPTGRIQWRARLAAAHYEIRLVETPADLPQHLANPPADLVLLDHHDLGEALAICGSLRRQPHGAEIPIVLSGPDAGPDARLAALAAGATDLVERSCPDALLLARLRSLLRTRDTQAEVLRRRSAAEAFGFSDAGQGFQRRGRIALVAETPAVADAWRRALEAGTRDRIAVLDQRDALATADDSDAADVYVIAVPQARTDAGLCFLADLRSRSEPRRAAVIAVLQPGEADTAARALDLGASDLLAADFHGEELVHRVRTQIRRKAETDALATALEDGMRLATTDPLTGLSNRRYAMSRAEQLLRTVRPEDRPVAVLIGDLDHFKRINDTWGHAAGDAVLVEVARRMRANLRGADIIARIGGEEFLVVMPDTDAAQAGPAAARLCRSIASEAVDIGGGRPPVAVTMSIGVASTGTTGAAETLSALMERADRALYGAKASGRNQITVAAAA